MWHRLKSSLISASLASLLVLGFLAVAEPAQPPGVGAPLYGLTGMHAEHERVAFQLAVSLTALALDAAIAAQQDAQDARGAATIRSSKEMADRTRAAAAAARMPFYSFAAKAARRTEAGT
jgi:hypothetical protein